MGHKLSKRNKPVAEPSLKTVDVTPGLSPIEDLMFLKYDIENLVFSGGGAKDNSYAGAVMVLEKLGILKKIKRFTGVGTGAIVATLLAVGFDCKQMQYLYNQLNDYLQIDDYIGRHKKTMNGDGFGWNAGETFLDWFGQMFETKMFEPDLTFIQLYQASGKELCLVLTDISKVYIEYCHPKTTPNLSIREAVFKSLSIPGVHSLKDLKSQDNVYFNGGLLCNYPIHSFDGWWLSMKPKDAILNRLEVPAQYRSMHQVFRPRNLKTIGFVLLDKYTVNTHQELKDRLRLAGGQACIPDTCLGKQYKLALIHQQVMESRFYQLRQISLDLCKEALEGKTEEGKTEEGLISAGTLARGYLNDAINPRKLAPLVDESFENCVAYLKKLDEKHSKLCSEWLEHVFKKRILSMLEEISDFYMTKTNHICSYFSAIFDIIHQSTMTIEREDFHRTIGIPCGHVISNNDLVDDDKLFLYKQGWNATVAYLRQMHGLTNVDIDSD